ncbi:uncharacterized protein LOC126971345 [Leptidea sinapis]|uniref:uncharacterized protein LOC126971345 n=1 Tax=Leptidea sinapis TaxID=189913 RepID=UPI0021274A92|nr:uncharacterized protein LOC126971345 [Leptidea sinapis]XP_050673557.1 uncharacterized protein LOC126971345 [Leptidea sinapis]
MAATKWRTSCHRVVLICAILQIVNGYEEYSISQLSPKSVTDRREHLDVLRTSQVENQFRIEPSINHENIEIPDEETVDIVETAEPSRGSRSINIEDIPSTNNNEIDNEVKVKRKYYQITPTKTIDFRDEEDMIMSSGFGDKLNFKFPGEAKRVPQGRALRPAEPKIKPTAVQPIFATVNPKEQGRQNTEIQNIITGIVKLLNGNVNVQANSQLLNGRPRPMASRINNRGPPRISDVPPLEFDKPATHSFVPTKTPPPYPFDLPANLPDQMIPPRPGFHRPVPPWQRRPRPPTRRPNPSLPVYKPTIPPLPELDLNENNEDEQQEHENVSIEITTEIKNVTESQTEKPTTEIKFTTERVKETTIEVKNITEMVKEATTEITTTAKAETTTETAKSEKPKKKEVFADKKEKIKNDFDKVKNVTMEIEPSMVEHVKESTPAPTVALPSVVHSSESTISDTVIKTSSINTLPISSTESIPYHPYRPRPGIVLDDPDFKPHGSRVRDAPVITAPQALPGYGEIFDVTVSAIQGPGEKGASVHIENINIHHDDIIVSPSGDQGFVSIDGKRTYLNLFDTSTSIAPTRVQTSLHTVPKTVGPVGIAVPADDVQQPIRRPPPIHRPQHTYKRPQPTVRIDTCIVGDDSTCDQAQNEKCRTEAGISSCQCRPGYARRIHRDPCRRVVALLLDIRVDRLYDRKVAWDSKLADKDSEPYQQLSYEAVRAIDSAFSMTPFSDDFVLGSVNSVYKDDESSAVYVNCTVLIQETAETVRSSVATEIQKQLLGVIRRRSNNVGASALWVDSVARSVLPLRDVDECSSADLNDCHKLARCTNTFGAFKCECPDTTLDPLLGQTHAGRQCRTCSPSHCSERGVCHYKNGNIQCTCSSGYYGSGCEVDGEVVGVSVGASLAAALVIALTLAALTAWSRKWSREQKAMGMGSPVFNYMASNTIKTPPVGLPPYQVTLEERMRWAQIAEAMAQANHYAPTEPAQMSTRPSSAMFAPYPTLPPVPMPRMGLQGTHTGTLNTSRANTSASLHNIYGYSKHMASESSGSEASSHVQDRADLLVPRAKSRSRSMHNQTGIYYDVEYENAPEPIYGTKGIPLSTYTVTRGPPYYRT